MCILVDFDNFFPVCVCVRACVRACVCVNENFPYLQNQSTDFRRTDYSLRLAKKIGTPINT